MLVVLCMPSLARADGYAIPPAPPGTVETGVPAFVVLGREALGLSATPTDLRLMPDGRVLVTTEHELAFGDGARWSVYRAAADVAPIYENVATDSAGNIYFGVSGGFGRVEFTDQGQWRLSVAATFDAAKVGPVTLISVDTLGDSWYWHTAESPVVQWRPGTKPEVKWLVPTMWRMFTLNGEVFASDNNNGATYRLRPDNTAEAITGRDTVTTDVIASSVRFDDRHILLGTRGSGLKLFDGKTFRPFGQRGLLTAGLQFSDLCAVGDSLFAAAVETVGIVIFDRQGVIQQVLDRRFDHRLSRTKHLVYSPNGVLWALLTDGIACVCVPSPLSQLDPLISSSMTFALPLRHAGKLWLLTDGRATRGIYDEANRLDRFETDTPPGRYVYTLQDVDGELLAATEEAVYRYENGHWTQLIAGIRNARIGIAPTTARGWLYAAIGEVGYLRRDGSRLVAERFPVPGLENNYNAITSGSGIVWLELGSRVARIDARGATPTAEILDKTAGLFQGWIETFLYEDEVRFHVPDHQLVFDEKTHRFIEDRELLARFPRFTAAGARPTRDASGRFWFTDNRVTSRIQPNGTIDSLSVGFTPSSYTTDSNGIVWIYGERRMSRFDTRVPPLPPVPVTAKITSVLFTGSGRHLLSPGAALPLVKYEDNSLTFNFAAPANPFSTAVTFETLLEGGGTEWTSVGTIGSAAFTRLKEGHYVFHVRPVLGATKHGVEARIAFDILPPWYRSRLAWAVYAVIALGLVGAAAWLSAYLQRREKVRLERLVAARTSELHTMNRQLEQQILVTTEKSVALAASEERYRDLNAELEQRVAARTNELSSTNQELRQRELLFRLIFEHAPVGIWWKRTDLGEFHHFNPTLCRILALSTDRMSDFADLARLLHSEDAARVQELNRQLGTGAINTYETDTRFVLPGDRIVWAALSVAVIRNEQGQIIQNIGILEDVTKRKQAEQELARTYKDLIDASRRAGMAEVASGVLHNVGNVLNSVNVSSLVIGRMVRESKVEMLSRVVGLLHDHASDLGTYLTTDAKGKLIPKYLATMVEQMTADRARLTAEAAALHKNIEHIKDIVVMQQSYATTAGLAEAVDPAALFEDALQMNSDALAGRAIAVVRHFQPTPPVRGEKARILQILTNLIRNAKHACEDAGTAEKRIVARIVLAGSDRVRLVVEDNGVGIPSENLTRIFGHGFTTRAYGHGFGLHSSALAAKEMKGSLTAASAGAGQGATFTLELPVASAGNALRSEPVEPGAGAVEVSLEQS